MAYRMICRRAKAADIHTKSGNHTFQVSEMAAFHWSRSPNSKNFTASLSPIFHGRSFGTIQENSKRSLTSSGNGSGGMTFAKVIETLAQLRG
jgi:hypothetical protein